MTAKQFLRSFKSLWGLGILVTAAGPLAMWAPDLDSPWPDSSAKIATLLSAVAGILAFSLGRAYFSRVPKQDPNKNGSSHTMISFIASAGLLLGVACALTYFLAYNKFVITEVQTVENQERKLRLVVGSERLSEFQGLAISDLDLLRDYQYEPERIWGKESVQRHRFLLFSTFAATFCMLTFGIGLFASCPNERKGPSYKSLQKLPRRSPNRGRG